MLTVCGKCDSKVFCIEGEYHCLECGATFTPIGEEGEDVYLVA